REAGAHVVLFSPVPAARTKVVGANAFAFPFGAGIS
ncbi:MAG: hypothetical protein K0S21_3568, partial [Rhizobiaceae bacterium]|nr:hypothetical protein [Rhizobiaceae bacterium]